MAEHEDAGGKPDKESADLRRRFTIPPQDESVQRWADEQISLSASLRLVIREWIERHGYGDATCLPVEQLPPRGRPPRRLPAQAGNDDDQGDQESQGESASQSEQPAPAQAAQPAQPAEVDEAAGPDGSDSAGEDESPDMDAIFAANRR